MKQRIIKDTTGDTAVVSAAPGCVYVTFRQPQCMRSIRMRFSREQSRELRKALKRAEQECT